MVPKLKLTKTNIDRVAKAGLSRSDVLHWDTEIKGFGLRVTPTGKATFIAQGRVNGVGDAVRVTVGTYGIFSPEQARDAAKEHLRNMGLGIDPRELKKQDEALNVTLRSVADAYFARPGKLKDSTRNEMDRQIQTVFAAWENRAIASITEDDVRKRYREMTTKGMRGKAGKPRSSPFTVWFGSIEVLVDTFIIPGIQNRLFDGREMVDLVGAIRSWEANGHYDC